MINSDILEKVYLSLGTLFLIIAIYYFLEDYVLAIPPVVKGIYSFVLAYSLIFYANIVESNKIKTKKDKGMSKDNKK